MKKKFSALMLLCTVALSLLAQRHDYNWIIGERCDDPADLCTRRISFEQWPPKVKVWNDQLPYFFGSQMTCSDSAGRIIFYGNGTQLRNRNRQAMKGSSLIKFGPYPGQSGSVVVPRPGHPNQYCYFHTASHNQLCISACNQKLMATVIDMEGDNGLGTVLSPSDSLLDEKISLLQACKHGNGRDWWIIAPIVGKPRFYTFLLSPAGVEGPFVQDFPIPSEGFSDLVLPYSAVAMSPDGEHLVRTHELDQIAQYRFDRCTGLFEYRGNMSVPPSLGAFFYVAFSPNSRMLYAAGTINLYQADMEAWPRDPTLLRASGFSAFPDTTVSTHMMLGADGKIYVSSNFPPHRLGIIHRPDLPGLAADYSAREFYVGELPYGIPSFPNYRLGVWEDSPCDTLGFKGPHDPAFSPTYWSPRASIQPAPCSPQPDVQRYPSPSLYSLPARKPSIQKT
ncbi:MAG TPA: hypothetical protein PKD78_06235 [Saprospiraceae bacterium]|nr:hypothetical protein [Saprospiraceae bacterium]